MMVLKAKKEAEQHAMAPPRPPPHEAHAYHRAVGPCMNGRGMSQLNQMSRIPRLDNIEVKRFKDREGLL